MAVILIGAIAFATDSAFGAGGHRQKKKTEYNQATVEVNDCGNGENLLNVGCQNTASQIAASWGRPGIGTPHNGRQNSCRLLSALLWLK